ncbi:hypothetical protein ACXZ65_34505 [Streptomyces aculeolatus]
MSAALHLAHAHQPPPGPKRKRNGGDGGGQDFYEFAKRVYADDRAGADARSLLLALAFAVRAEPGDGKAQWALVRQALGTPPVHLVSRRSLTALIEDDVPRYTPPEHLPGGYDPTRRTCQGPRLRPYRTRMDPSRFSARQIAAQARRDEEDWRNTEGVCGERGQISVLEKQPGTGWHITHYFCNRHQAEARRVREQVREQNQRAPAPIPNQGGLLPSYFDADWLDVYRRCRGPQWEPPVYGICADDWPVPGREAVPMKARLRIASVDGELIGATS